MWDWLQQLSGGAGAFLGALAGSFFGLLAILGGALYNAHLNRKRDDRIRQQDTYTAAQAVLGELQAVHAALVPTLRICRKTWSQAADLLDRTLII